MGGGKFAARFCAQSFRRLGSLCAELHRAHGVRTIFEDTVAAFEGDGHVASVVTRGGLRLECDFVVAGVGIEPAVEITEGSGIGVDNGVIVDEFLETNISGIFAAGDVANHYHPLFGRYIRLEHWQNAVRQGAAAAHNMLGQRSSYREIPWFWSDQYDLNLQDVGFHTTWDEMVVRGRLDGGHYLACYINNGRVDAAVGINRPRDIRRILPLIRSRASVDLKRLQDESVDLRSQALFASN